MWMTGLVAWLFRVVKAACGPAGYTPRKMSHTLAAFHCVRTVTGNL